MKGDGTNRDVTGRWNQKMKSRKTKASDVNAVAKKYVR